MAFHYCPQCGSKLQPDFKFCPSCGERLPCSEAPAPIDSSLFHSKSIETFSTAGHKIATSSSVFEPKESPAVSAFLSTTPASVRPPLRKTRNSLRLDNLSIKDAPLPVSSLAKVTVENATQVDKGLIQSTPPKMHSVSFKSGSRDEASQRSPSAISPQNVRGKAKRKAVEIVEDVEVSSMPRSSPVTSPSKGKGKYKKTKVAPALEPLQEGTEVTDTAGKKWKLVRLQSQQRSCMKGAKDGKIFNEQNFLQRAAKPASIEKWIKQNKMDFIGVPQCVGFGLHADSYRFLIFPNIGHSLQSLMNKNNSLLSEVTVLILAARLLDVLLYIHSNEYVHADINAENIYINEGHGSQVYLAAYNHAFRYCPGGQHVEYREGSRTPHEGAVEFISLDSHNGAAPSRRSDLQSLGYCMLYWHTGILPWTTLDQPQQIAAEKRKYAKDVPGLLLHCFGKKKVSGAFRSFLSSVMALDYNQQPDYKALKSGLTAALTQLGGSVEQPLHI